MVKSSDKIAEIIKYEGDNQTFVHKHEAEDFNSLSQLIVHESQEAVFMMNGQALDLFGAGRYTLETQNIPKIGKILNRPTGDKTPFHCEVYFVNKTVQMAIPWGTAQKFMFMEPQYNFPIQLGAFGTMSLRVTDSRKLLVKLVGTENDLSRESLVKMFRGLIQADIKSLITRAIKEQQISIFEIDENLLELSDGIKKSIAPTFDEYGLEPVNFKIDTVQRPDGDASYEKFKSLHFRQYADIAEAKLRQQTAIIDEQTKAQRTVIESQAMATKRAQEGYTYQQERGFDVAQDVAKNEAVGQFTNMGVGFGTMAGVGGVVGGMVGGAVNDALSASQAKAEQTQPEHTNPVPNATCAKCGSELPAGAKFCLECGEKVKIPNTDTVTCPNCGADVPNKSFCPECGAKLVKKCKSCGAEIGNAKFCPECGTQQED